MVRGVEVVLNPAAMHHLLHSPVGVVGKAMFRTGHRIRTLSLHKVGVDTGRLRSDIGVESLPGGGVRIGSKLEYAIFHHEGHGIIRPVRARVLIFTPRGSDRPVVARSVRAVEPNKYLVEPMIEIIRAMR